MVYAAAILLTSVLTIVGILAIWASTSRVSWLWRAFVFSAFISCLLLIPAIEPFIAFALQGAIVAVGVTWIPWAEVRNSGNSIKSFQFRLGTLLLLIVPISVLIAAVTYIWPSLNQDAWQSIVTIGVAGGLGSFIGWWMGTRKASDWRVRTVVALVFWISVSAIAARCDWFVICFENLGFWPPDVQGTDWGFLGLYGKNENVNVWYLIIGAQVLFTNYLIQESTSILASLKSRASFKFKKLAIATFIYVAVIVAGPSLIVGYEFLTRYSVPEAKMPQPNGYEDFLAARNLMPEKRIVDRENIDFWNATEAELHKAKKELAEALIKVHEGLNKPSSVPVDYFDPEYPDEIQNDFLSLYWGIYVEAKIEQRQGEMDRAANRFLDLISFAICSSKGGLMLHDQRSTNLTEHGIRELYLCMNHLPANRIADYIERLHQLESEYEPAESFVRRSDIWMQRSHGWYGHLASLFGEKFHPRLFEVGSYLVARRISASSFKLLETELAICVYQVDYQKLPESLAELVPEYLPEVPLDPHSPQNDRLRYQRDQNSYILYSVGPNGVDDQGKPMTQSLSYALHGDFRLSDLYDPAEDSE